MAKLNQVRRIITEEFAQADQDMISKLAYIMNNFMEQVVDVVNGNLDMQNLNQQIKTIDITVNSAGVPTTSDKISYDLKTRVQGIVCIKAENLTNVNSYPTSSPFISYSENGNLLTVKSISGLQALNKYRLTLLIIGKDIRG